MSGVRVRRGCWLARRRRSVVKVQSAGQILRRLLANWRCQRVRLLFGLASSSSARSSVWIGGDLGLELVAVVVLVLVGAPGGEHLLGERDALLAEGLLLGEPVGVAAEVALEV